MAIVDLITPNWTMANKYVTHVGTSLTIKETCLITLKKNMVTQYAIGTYRTSVLSRDASSSIPFNLY